MKKKNKNIAIKGSRKMCIVNENHFDILYLIL